MWWSGKPTEKYWFEIRRIEGIGTALESPELDVDGHANPWYQLMREVRPGDVVYHYNANESRFVGRSEASSAVSASGDGFRVELQGFTPFVAQVGLAELRDKSDAIYTLRDKLQTEFGRPLYLPFQFTKKRSQFRMMSNYLTKAPAELVKILFGDDGLAAGMVPHGPGSSPKEETNPIDEELVALGQLPPKKSSFLNPFKAKADSNYVANVAGGRSVRTRGHETLVNDFEAWLRNYGLETGRNAAIDLGVIDPEVIIEAKTTKAGWSGAIRQAVGQLYEYRYFKVASPSASLVFLADRKVPDSWIKYLEKDRSILVAYRSNTGFHLSQRCRKVFKI